MELKEVLLLLDDVKDAIENGDYKTAKKLTRMFTKARSAIANAMSDAMIERFSVGLKP